LSPPVGPTGIATTCRGDDDDPPRWHASATYGVFGTELVGAPAPLTMTRAAFTASVDYRISSTSTFGGGAGVGTGGTLTAGARRFRISPGWEVTAAYSRRLLDGRGRLPFLLLSIAGGGSGAWTREDVFTGPTPGTTRLFAFDIRAGLTVGKTFWNVLSPYAVFRAFGGPVIWAYDGKTVVAGDRYHVQLGAGLVTSLPRGVDVFVEGVPLGERGLTLGAGRTF